MLLTKIISSLENCFLDNDISMFSELSRVSLLKNEKLSFQILCTHTPDDGALRRLYDLRIEGALAEYVSVREVVSVPVTMPVVNPRDCDNYLRSAPGLYPDLLLPLRYGNKVSVLKGCLCSLWIDIDLREAHNVLAGESTLKFYFVYGDNLASTPSIVLDVINAELPEQELKFTEWFYCDCLANYYNCEVWSERHWEIIENFANTAVKNGINMLLTPVFTPSLDTYIGGERLTTQLVGVKKESDEYSFDFSLLDRWIDMCDRIGIQYLEISHFFTQWGARHAPKIMATVDGEYKKIFGWETDATDHEYVDFLRSFVAAFLHHMKYRGDDKRCYFHISDEPTKEHLESYNAAKNAISDLLDGYVIMDALSNFEFYSQGLVETPIPSSNHIEPFLNADIEGLWTYYCSSQWKDVSNRFIAMPSYRNRSIGMQMYKYNIVGFLHWGYNFYNNQFSYDAIDPYTDTCGDGWVPAGDTFSVYPGADGNTLESLRISVFYDALQDLRAMKLAESLCGKESVLKAIEEAFGDKISFNKCAHTSAQMLSVRDAVNNLIKNNV